MESLIFNATVPGLGDFVNMLSKEDPLSKEAMAQWISLGVMFCLVSPLWRMLKKRAKDHLARTAAGRIPLFFGELGVSVLHPALYFIACLMLAETFRELGFAYGALNGARDLAGAWMLIRLLTGFLPNRTSARIVSIVVVFLVALNLTGMLEAVLGFLDGVGLALGETRFTALGVAKGILLAVILLQCASAGSRFFQEYVDRKQKLSPSIKVLFGKTVKILLFSLALFISVSSIGVDLTHLAVFSGALGVGIGFGLKTIFSNLISGVILLVDESIKPGDVITVGNVFGQVTAMHGRYVSVLTRDGVEYLIPNEELFAGQVVNWTHSDSNVRLKIPVGVDFKSDLHKAMLLMEQAAQETHRVLRHPQPGARLMGFGDNTVDLELRIWISDAHKGVTNVKSAVRLRIWELFKENDVNFPFPQRDVFIKPDSSLRMVAGKGEESGQ